MADAASGADGRDDRGAAPIEVDLIVLGAGSGNPLVNHDVDDRSVVLVDDGRWFGGTCLNAGCIPTKMLVRVADDQVDAQDAAALGLAGGGGTVDWPAVRDRVFGRIDRISQGGEHYRAEEAENVTLVRETVVLDDPHTIRTRSGVRYRARDLVLAAGSRPRVLPAIPMDDPAVHDSDTIMRVDELPESLLIVGGGSIAVEFAHIFSAYGSRVTIVARGARLLSDLDDDVSATFTDLARDRWDLRLGTEVRGLRRDGGHLVVELTDGEAVRVTTVLVAAGRIPNSDRIGAAEVGLDLEDDGRVVVDDRQRVFAAGEPLDGVWGLGDLVDAHQLKHVANHQARVVSHNLRHPDDPMAGNPGPVPAAVFSHPQIAHFGLTERDARDADLDVVAVTQEYGSTAFGWAIEDTTSFCKLVVDRATGALLGAHIIGPEASILLQPLIQAAASGRGIRGLAREQYWPHPAATEIVENALLAAEAEL